MTDISIIYFTPYSQCKKILSYEDGMKYISEISAIQKFYLLRPNKFYNIKLQDVLKIPITTNLFVFLRKQFMKLSLLCFTLIIIFVCNYDVIPTPAA